MRPRLLERWRGSSERTGPATLAAAVVVVAACWIIGTPRSAGPDEPNHMIASAGMVRGDLEGEPYAPARSFSVYQVPGMVGAPDPACWVLAPGAEFSGRAPVSCGDDWVRTTDPEPKLSRASDYAPFAYVLPGLASYVPWPEGYAYLARALMAAIPIALVTASLVLLLRRSPTLAVAGLFGITPIAWFSMAIVNPSSVAIGGGFALWTGVLLTARATGDDDGVAADPPGVPAAGPAALWSRPEMLAVAGWVALVLPRRDGPLFATLVVVGACLVAACPPGELYRRLGRTARVVVVVAALLPLLTAAFDRGTVLDVALVLTPALLVPFDAVWRWLRTLPGDTARWFVTLATPVAVLGAFALVMAVRRGGYDAVVLRRVVGATDDHLRQWVGVLGWLDTPVPSVAVWLYWALLAALAAVAVVRFPRAAVVGVGCVVAAVLVAWALELGQGSTTGRYWQGRYSTPFAVGIPLALAWRPWFSRGSDPSPRTASVAKATVIVVAAGAWIIAVAAFVAAQRRWGVGVDGTRRPWRWDTWDTVIPPVVLMALHAAATATALAVAVAGVIRALRPADDGQ